jgi:dienelactone hydrolase
MRTGSRAALPLIALLAACKSQPASPPLRLPLGEGAWGDLVVYAPEVPTRRGFLSMPAGTAPFPAIVINHGSEKFPGAKQDIAAFFNDHGYVTLVPHRRGHGRSDGRYIIDEMNDAFIWQRSTLVTERLVEQVDDVAAAVSYLRTKPYVDRARIAVVGCSFGGIESLLAAERDLPIRSAVDFAGGAMSWGRFGNWTFRARLRQAARNARVPVFFIQAENDYDTTPSLTLAADMQKAGRPHRLKIFPPHGRSPAEGHGFCVGGLNPAWGPDVLAFLDETMSKR